MEKILIKKHNPVNRDEKRKFEKELKWLEKWYDEVCIPLEIEFWHELKDSDLLPWDGSGYVEIYEKFKYKFISARDKTNHIRRKHYFIDINLFYFENLYKPIEKE